MDVRANSASKRQRFTKSPGRRRRSIPQPRLTRAEHQAFCLLITGPGKANPRRLRAWGKALETLLVGSERISTANGYTWLANRLRTTHPMRLQDAAKIYVAGMRMREPSFEAPAQRERAIRDGQWVHSVIAWQEAVSKDLAVIPHYHFAYGVPGRFTGPYDKPFIPVMIPYEYVPELSEKLADLVTLRGSKTRAARGKAIEDFLMAKLQGQPLDVSWHFSTTYAIREIVMRVLFKAFYQGRIVNPRDPQDDVATTLGLEIEREIERTLADREPGAFGRCFRRLDDAVSKAYDALNASKEHKPRSS